MMKMNWRLRLCCVISIVIITVAIPSCKTNKPTQGAAPAEQVKEIAPGLLQGYLSSEELPNSLELIPPPPEEGSIAFALDQEYAKKAVESNDATRFNLATVDAELHFPAAVKSFESTIGIQISETKTPKLYLLMRRILVDAAMATYTAKIYYKRKRPFMVNHMPTCTPKDEESLRKDGSYPSGHTAIGWAWALVFTEIIPSKTDAILQRGYAFGESRVICNVHWHSDVETGRIMGAAAVAKLHANASFQRDLSVAKEEVKKLLRVH